MNKKTVVILGATGMIGNTIYLSFKNDERFYAIGTSRDKVELETLHVDDFQISLKRIIRKYEKIDCIINCIGNTTKYSSVNDLIEVNSLFPQNLAKSLLTNQLNLIHISSDAVYSIDTKDADETTTPTPDTLYGASKLLGEPNTLNCISIRTSIIGMDNNKNDSLLDWARKTKKGKIFGYTNHNWSGCTSLQLADFCKELIFNWNKKTRKLGSFINFAPIQSKSKYEILNAAHKLNIVKAKVIRKKNTNTIIRNLSSIYFDKMNIGAYTNDIIKALEELKEFNNKYE